MAEAGRTGTKRKTARTIAQQTTPAVTPPEASVASTLPPEVQEKMRVLLTDLLAIATDISTDLGIVECNHKEECVIYKDCRELALKMREFRTLLRTTQI